MDKVLLDKDDFEAIKSLALREYLDKSYPKYVGKDLREIGHDEANVLSIIEATMRFLETKDVFSKKPEFDYQNRSHK